MEYQRIVPESVERINRTVVDRRTVVPDQSLNNSRNCSRLADTQWKFISETRELFLVRRCLNGNENGSAVDRPVLIRCFKCSVEYGILKGLRIMRYSQPMSKCFQKPASRIIPAVIPFAAPSVDPTARPAAASPVSADFVSAKSSLSLRT